MSKISRSDASRRRFFVSAGAAFAVVVVADTFSPDAFADDLPRLDPGDAAAKALGYTEDASEIDAAKFPSHKAAQSCVNCNFYSGKPEGSGPCQLFPGKAVKASGWCVSWDKEK